MKKKKRAIPKKTALLLGLAAVLLLGSAVGSTRAALTYYSENYVAGVEMSSIGLTLLENGKLVGERNYDKNGAWMESSAELLTGLTAKEAGRKLVPGKHYEEKLTVSNSGNIDSYVRLIVTTRWLDKEKKEVPVTTLDPGLIELHVPDGSGWVEDESARTQERSIWYLNGILKAGEAKDFSDYLRISPEIQDEMTESVETADGMTTYTYVYAYDGYSFQVQVCAEAVQTHNAADAVKSAWGENLSEVITNVSGN